MKFNTAVLKGLDDIKKDLSIGLWKDEMDKKEAMVGLNKALDKLEDEGEFAAKLTKYTTAWGKSKLAQDLLAQVQGHRDRIVKDMDNYKKQTEGRTLVLKEVDSGDDKLFG